VNATALAGLLARISDATVSNKLAKEVLLGKITVLYSITIN
jgi:hypothetical protein